MSLLSKALGGAFMGRRRDATLGAIEDLHYHNPFSAYVPWYVYDDASRIYLNTDGTTGFLWECTPICFSGEKTVQISESLLRIPLPDYSVLQILLHADPDIKNVVDTYRRYRDGGDELTLASTEAFIQHLRQCVKGSPRLANIPLRNFRLFISLKFPSNAKGINYPEIHSQVHEILNGMSLSPRTVEPSELLDWGRRLFNDQVSDHILDDDQGRRWLSAAYDPSVPINRQLILSETDVEVEFSHVRIGKKYLRSISPKVYPEEVDPLQTSELFGAHLGMGKDNNQHRTPFLYALNIIFEDMKSALRTKCDLVLNQHGVGSWARTLARKQDEYQWAIDRLDQGEKFVRIMPLMFFLADSVEQANDAVMRAKRMWEENGYYMQEDKGVLGALFLSALPFGLRATKENLNMFVRDTIVSGEAIANLLPVQGGFAGSNEPVMVMQDRKGQIASLNIFSKKANNYNGMILASSGAGKSFFMNMMAQCLKSVRVKIRAIDIGSSYKKLCLCHGGRFLDFGGDDDVVLNPFTNIVDIDEDLAAIAEIVCQMVYSGSSCPKPSENERTLAKKAVRWAYDQAGNRADVDLVWEYLRGYPDSAGGSGVVIANDEIIGDAHRMAFNMENFTSRGTYGRYFTGPSTFNISEDDFLVLELERLKPKEDLFRVVTLVVLDAVTRDLYLSDRSERRIVFFDEMWQFVSGDNPMFESIIESGFRRARKYSASFFGISQSLLDLKRFGKVGDVLWNNADFKFLLESDDFDKAAQEKILDYDSFTMEMLKTVRTNKPRYSEIFMDTPFGRGIVRLAVDDFNYFLFTSDGVETAEIESLIASGMTPVEAINEMVRKYRG